MLANPAASKGLTPRQLAQYREEVNGWQKDIAVALAKLRSKELQGALPDVRVGSPSPSTKATTPEGRDASLPDLRGKVVVLEFWMIDCPPCRAFVPLANALL